MFMISVMNNEGVSQQSLPSARKLRNLIAPEAESVLCEDAGDPANCKVAMGFGLGWRIVEINNETILDHTGADSDVKTFAFFIPKRKTGAIIFTDGPNVGHQMIDKVLGILYPNRIYDATLWQSKWKYRGPKLVRELTLGLNATAQERAPGFSASR